jgi:NADPH:quinone reductase-like Zn-dependent oxidoreductase
MRSIVVFGGDGTAPEHNSSCTQEIEIKGQRMRIGMVKSVKPDFDPAAPANASSALLRVRAFSCNYRDLAFLFATAKHRSTNEYFCLGSDFVAEVLALGQDVTRLAVGDRVIGNCEWSEEGANANFAGLPTNHASREFQVLPEAKLVKIPPSMSTEVAGGFTIGAQTVYSMLRRLDLQPEQRALVTAAKSNTSLFAISALHNFAVNVYATSTSGAFADRLEAMGVREVALIDPQRGDFSALHELARRSGKFDAVIDPFFDLHLPGIMPSMKLGARYITCGLYNQYQNLLGAEAFTPRADLAPIMIQAMIGNIQLIGNCLGLTEDLQAALRDYEAGKLEVIVDSVFTAESIGAFFDRTYNASDRFGKVIYQYS